MHGQPHIRYFRVFSTFALENNLECDSFTAVLSNATSLVFSADALVRDMSSVVVVVALK